MNETDCGMEVIRWLCRERRDHLTSAHFFVHTHNSLAGLLMVLQMQAADTDPSSARSGWIPPWLFPGRTAVHQLMVVTEATKSWPRPRHRVGGRGMRFKSGGVG